VHDEFRQPRGKHRVDEQRFEQRDGLEPKNAVDQERKRAGVPELRCVGTRIRARTPALTARIPADALRDAMFRIPLREVEERVRELQCPRVEAKTAKTEG
jgi:hypothetical protein